MQRFGKNSQPTRNSQECNLVHYSHLVAKYQLGKFLAYPFHRANNAVLKFQKQFEKAL